MTEPGLLIIIIVLFVAFMMVTPTEGFSKSGLSVSDKYCTKLSNVYYRPYINDDKCRCNYHERICGKQRINTVDSRTGNYFTENHTLV